jgi:ferredoxin-like protein FixX
VSAGIELKSLLGLNSFKASKNFHIAIKPGMEQDPRLAQAAAACPAGLYKIGPGGVAGIGQDGCLECGTCWLICGQEVLDWVYPEAGVSYRFG